MFGINYIKTDPTQYVLHYQNGTTKRSGTGLSFYYYAPMSSIVVVPIGSQDIPFIFNEATADFQPVTVQGQLTYRVTNPDIVAALLNYTIDDAPNNYVSDDPDKLPQRLVNLAQVMTRAEIAGRDLRSALAGSDEIAGIVQTKLSQNETVTSLGVEVIAFVILAIKPTPDIARALEAEARESLQRQADDAIYDRRNSAVEQERRIKENELNTQIAVETKNRQIRETKVAADLAIETKQQEIREAQLNGQIALEEERKKLVASQSENAKAKADAEAYAVAASLQTLASLDPGVLELLGMQSAEPRLMIAKALQGLADNAGKIGQLNISPDLLESLLENRN
jgi:hypothetical protein